MKVIAIHLILFWVVLYHKLIHVVGFAAWLKCYVDITDTEEIVMNYLILPKDQAKHGEVRIEVKGLDDDHWVTEDYTFDPTQTTKIMARLKVPSTLSEMDVQYVMDIISNDTNSDNVQFTRPANICKGKRAHATHYTDSAVLEIPAAMDNGGSLQVPPSVQLIAVYATGHEAVTQTEILTIRPIVVEEEL